MSYDIYCYKHQVDSPDLDDADTVISADNDKWSKKDFNAETKLALLKALTTYNPDLKAIDFNFGNIASLSAATLEKNKNKFDHIEINPEKSDIAVRLTIFCNHVLITVPYTYSGKKAELLFADISAYIKIITDTAGYFVFDPQTGSAFDPKKSEFEGLPKYLEVSRDF